MIKKKFTLIVEVDDSGMTLNSENTGFTAPEILGILDIKRDDILNQIRDRSPVVKHFKRTVKTDDQIVDIEEVKE